MRHGRLRPSLLLLAAAGAVPLACGGGDESVSETAAAVEEVPVPPAPAPASGEGTTAVSPVAGASAGAEAGAAQAAETGRTGVAEATAPTDSAAALARLDRWHRELAAARSDDGDSALAGLAAVARGEGAAWRAELRRSAPDGYGPNFARIAAAWAEGGAAAGLEAAAPGVAALDPAALAWTEALASEALARGETEVAGRAFGRLLPAMIEAGYPRERVLELAGPIRALARQLPEVLPSFDYEVQPNDSYWAIGVRLRKQGKPAYVGWIKAFNGRTSDTLRVGEVLRIPEVAPRIEVWRQPRLTAVWAGDYPFRLYPSSSGKPESPTPVGEFTLDICERDPVYYPPGGRPVPFGNPDNPLGTRWLGFAEDRQYGLHGTNQEETVGTFETGGCIRLHNADAEELFDLVGPGVKVTIHP